MRKMQKKEQRNRLGNGNKYKAESKCEINSAYCGKQKKEKQQKILCNFSDKWKYIICELTISVCGQ